MTTVEILKEMAFTATETQRRALEDAISALSADGDCISRQAVLNTLDNMDKALDEERTVEKYKELLVECIKVLPSAENKTDLQSAYDCGYNQACKDKIVSPYKAERGE